MEKLNYLISSVRNFLSNLFVFMIEKVKSFVFEDRPSKQKVSRQSKLSSKNFDDADLVIHHSPRPHISFRDSLRIQKKYLVHVEPNPDKEAKQKALLTNRIHTMALCHR